MKIKFVLAVIYLLATFSVVNAVQAQSGRMQSVTPSQEEDKVYKMSEVDKKIEVTSKPQPDVTLNCIGNGGGTADIYVIFHKSGVVTETKVTRTSGCDDFDRSSLKAAQNIKFKPALKNDQPVSVGTIVKYAFGVYRRYGRNF